MSIVETSDSSADVSKIVKTGKVREVDNITTSLGISNKDLINSDISQTTDCKPTSPVSKNCFDQIVHVVKDFIPIKFMKEGTIQHQSLDTHKERPKVSKNDDSIGSSDIASHYVLYPANLSNDEVNNILDQQGVILQDDDSSVEPTIEKVDAIHIHATEKPPSPWNMDIVAERLKNKRVEETTKAAKFKKPFKVCFKCGKEGYVVKHFKQVDKTSSSSSKRHGLDDKGNKNCFSGLKSIRNNSLNNQMKNYSSRSPYVKPVSHNSKIKSKKDSPRYSYAPVSKSPKPSKVNQTYVPKSFASKLKHNIVSNFKSFKTKIPTLVWKIKSKIEKEINEAKDMVYQ
ncbi:hypothetical protein L1987_15202 [Smallanthus sonchifolius]|uniref:Uncharacterized protein n=1 Tax=Smallanthus sonchifolius TaxID=185202 RepID=A0ACB9J730_9ASTR|nr:hypothetical protein L1987_15202 [Smallanthus sonchifolius]